MTDTGTGETEACSYFFLSVCFFPESLRKNLGSVWLAKDQANTLIPLGGESVIS